MKEKQLRGIVISTWNRQQTASPLHYPFLDCACLHVNGKKLTLRQIFCLSPWLFHAISDECTEVMNERFVIPFKVHVNQILQMKVGESANSITSYYQPLDDWERLHIWLQNTHSGTNGHTKRTVSRLVSKIISIAHIEHKVILRNKNVLSWRLNTVAEVLLS